VPLRILFVPFGSEGDVNPLLWLAEGMAARGHEPTFVLTPHYAPLIEERGYPWIPVGTKEDFLRFARDPRIWSRMHGPRVVMEGMIQTLAAYRQAIEGVKQEFDLFVLSSLALAAASIAERTKTPRLTLHMQPALFRSVYDCPVFMEELAWLTRAPRWIKGLFFASVDLLVWGRVRRQLNVFRGRIGLPSLQSFYRDALHGAEGVAALFPRWFASPQPDWPARVRQFGFPVSRHPRPLSDSLENFLRSGEPPLAWTHGSANFDIGHFRSRALAVSRELNLRCLLISLDAPAAVSDDAFHVAHARFEDVFPRCKAVVHHGGIGTTAKCIAAGIPQLIIPRSHDQPDNAQRIVQLGLGKALSYRHTDTTTRSQLAAASRV
jgi:rhamnosyltransferase subunit B